MVLQVPSTPPRRGGTRDLPATPATPRFGTFEDNPDEPITPVTHPKPKHSRGLSISKTLTTTPAEQKPMPMLFTPRQTPRKRVLFPVSTPQRGSGRVRPAHTPKRHMLNLPQSSQTLHNPTSIDDERHPHAAKPQGPGMWYVFRGKRIFRPLPPGEHPPEPKTLFADILGPKQPPQEQRSHDNSLFGGRAPHPPRELSHDSEEDTDVEW